MIIEVRNDLGLNDFEVSLLTGLAFSGFYCIAGLVLGALVDRHAIKRVLYFSVTVWSLAVAATGLAKSFWSVAAARMLTGVAEAGVNPGGQALISSAFPRSKVSLPMSLFAVSGTLGIGLSFFTGGLLLEAFTAHSIPGLESLAPWRQVMVAVGLPGLLFAFLAFTLKDTRSRPQTTSAPTTWRSFARFLFAERNLFVRILMAYGLVAVVNYGMSSWAPTYGRRVLKLTPAEVGTEIGMIVVFVGVPAAAFYGWLVDRFVARGITDFALRAFAVGAVSAVPMLVFGFTADRHAVFVATLILLQFATYSATGPGFAALMMVTPPEMRGRMAAVIVLCINLMGFACGPMIVGALTDFVFADPQKVGLSIALNGAVVAPLAAWSIWTARPYFTARLSRAEP
jgi:MFS family permease